MLVAYGVIIPVFLLVVTFIFVLSPKHHAVRKVRLFNGISVICAAGLSSGYVLYLKHAMEGGSDYGWWPVLSFHGVMVISGVVLTVAGLVRNIIVFRSSSF